MCSSCFSLQVLKYQPEIKKIKTQMIGNEPRRAATLHDLIPLQEMNFLT